MQTVAFLQSLQHDAQKPSSKTKQEQDHNTRLKHKWGGGGGNSAPIITLGSDIILWT